MRILIVGDQYPESFGKEIAVGFEELGHEVYAVDNLVWPRGSTRQRATTLLARVFPRVEWRVNEQICKKAEAVQPDLILTTYTNILPQAVRRLRATTGAKLAHWFPDHLANFDRQYVLASHYDALFFKEPYIVEFFRKKLGRNAHYLPEAFTPKWHKRVELTPEEVAFYGCDLTTASNMYYYRAVMLEQFQNYDMKIWGTSFPRWMESPLKKVYQNVYVAEEEKAKAFTAAKIVLNTMHYGEIQGVNKRTFEAAGCGAFQIADSKPVLRDLFEPGEEIVTFETAAELKEKVDYYLARPDERQAIARRAYERAHRDHTYAHRLRQMLAVIFGEQPCAT
jgi:spore maturation protein CgeB